MANTTLIAMGTNRKPATPFSANIGTKTMQMQSSETKAGCTIWRAPSRIAVLTSLPCSRCQLIFSMVTVASSTRMPTASARPPRVMMFKVWPVAHSPLSADSTASGIETAMMTVERQLPRNSRIIRLVRRGGDDAFARHAGDRRLDEDRLVVEQVDLEANRAAGS